MNVYQSFKESLSNITSTTFFSLTNAFLSKRVKDQELLNKGYLSNQDVYTVISRCSRICASVPFIITNNGEEVETTDEFYRFFVDSWNINDGIKTGLDQVFTNLFLYGAAYIKPKGILGLDPKKQFVLPSDKVMLCKQRDSYFEEDLMYQFEDVNKTIKILDSELVIVKFYDPDSINNQEDGLSPLQAPWNTVISEINRSDAERYMLENRGISGFLSPKAHAGQSYGLPEKTMNFIREVFGKIIGGAKNFSKILPIEDAVDYTPIGMTAEELKFIELRLTHVRDICNAYGVPSILFNDHESRTHANYREANRAMYHDFVLPMFELFLNEYDRTVIRNWNERNGTSYEINIDKKSIIPLNPDPDEVRKEVLSIYEKGLLSKSEARIQLNQPEEMPEEEVTPLERLMQLNPQAVNTLLNSMTEEQRQQLLREIGVIQ
jgi:HK97 family phage portal protein